MDLFSSRSADISGPRILYWLAGEKYQNFGDFLAVYLSKRALSGVRLQSAAYRLTGSALAEGILLEDIEALVGAGGGRIAYWGCGMRDEVKPSARTLAKVDIFGVRGPLTRDALELSVDTVLGDPGLLMPVVYRPKQNRLTAGRAVCVPHFNDPKDDDTLLAQSGADLVVRPKIPATLAAVEEFTDMIASARFVLAGALHAAVTATAYDVPFAFMDTGHVDIPFKWRDFAASVNITLHFAQNVPDGLQIYNELIKLRLKKPKLMPILRVCPFFIRPSVIVRALIADGIATTEAESISDLLADSYTESDEYISASHSSMAVVRQEAHAALQWLAHQASGSEAALRIELDAIRADALYWRDMLRQLQAAEDQNDRQVTAAQTLSDEALRTAEQQLAEMQRAIDDTKAEAKRYEAQLEEDARRYEAQLKEQETQMRGLLGSRSWRYTSPFRGTLTWAGRQKFRLRLTARALAPGQTKERSAIARAVIRRVPMPADMRAGIMREITAREDLQSIIPKSLIIALRKFGSIRAVSVPDFTATDDNTSAPGRMFDDIEGAAVVVFRDVLPSQLDTFFRSRMLQIARGKGPWPSLSFVVLRHDATGDKPAPGFANRARYGWPFARAIFATGGEPGAQSLIEKLLEVPIYSLCNLPAKNLVLPNPFLSGAHAGQPVAVQIQPLWGRCGSSTAFENQIEGLVESNNFVIRVFIDEHSRLGGTLTSGLERILKENSLNAAAHVNALALLPDPRLEAAPPERELDRFRQTIRAREICRITDRAAAEAALTADCVVVNHVLNIGFARLACPHAKLLLDVHDHFADGAAQRMKGQVDEPGEDHMAELRDIEEIEGLLWRVADVCTNVNIAELERVARCNERAVIVLPRPYVPLAINQQARYDWDALIVADQHHFNVLSVRWFLDEVWRPDPAIRDLRIAIAGRVDRHIDIAAYASEKLCFLGFVDDLDELRRRSALTLVPDRAGTGIAIKTLTALAAGHPVVSTNVGLRGLGDAVTCAMPGHSDAKSLAGDLRFLLSDHRNLAVRREAVKSAYQAIRNGPSFAQCLSDMPAISEAALRRREQLWLQISNLLPPLPSAQPVMPIDLESVEDALLLGPDSFHLYLGRGWHPQEGWGRWMDGSTAVISIPVTTSIPILMEFGFDVVVPLPEVWLTIAVNGCGLPVFAVTDGEHKITLPDACTSDTEQIEIVLTVSKTFCPSSDGGSSDTRVLGLGLRSFYLDRPRA